MESTAAAQQRPQAAHRPATAEPPAPNRTQVAIDRHLAPILAKKLATVGGNLKRAAEAGIALHQTAAGLMVSDAKTPELRASFRAVLSQIQAARTAGRPNPGEAVKPVIATEQEKAGPKQKL